MKQTGFKPKPPKKRRCKHCEAWFLPPKNLMPFCSNMCEMIFKEREPKVERQKIARKEKQAFNNQDVKKLTGIAKKLAQHCARLRDFYEPCVSCRKTTAVQWDGGHYMGADSYSKVRLNLWNIHKQCSHCNDYNSSNAANYRKHLIEKIGLEKVEWLEDQKGLHRYSAEYLNKYIRIFRKKLRIMKKRVDK